MVLIAGAGASPCFEIAGPTVPARDLPGQVCKDCMSLVRWGKVSSQVSRVPGAPDRMPQGAGSDLPGEENGSLKRHWEDCLHLAPPRNRENAAELEAVQTWAEENSGT